VRIYHNHVTCSSCKSRLRIKCVQMLLAPLVKVSKVESEVIDSRHTCKFRVTIVYLSFLFVWWLWNSQVLYLGLYCSFKSWKDLCLWNLHLMKAFLEQVGCNKSHNSRERRSSKIYDSGGYG
jgi:hypothetical protein